jgi:NAD(P)-dependent dehydrogenase (short-subunit alcohol dehydrogenase family)
MSVEDLFSIAGKTAVVTGGSRGIGYMIAHGYREAGARVYITARKAEQLEAAAEELSGIGECVAIPADLSTQEGLDLFANDVSSREESLDILVNNAGAAWGAKIDDYPASGFDKVLDLNVKGVFELTKRFLPLLQKAATSDDPARVINIGSVDGIRVPVLENYAYSASKAGVHMLTRHLAHHLVDRNITVNAIAPGPFPSKMTAFMFEAGEEVVAQGVPLGRVGRPDDMAGVAIFLASRASSYLTGAVIPVDGGVSTR